MDDDLTEELAQTIAVERFGVGTTVRQEDDQFVVYQVVPLELPRQSGRHTIPLDVQEVAIGRGKTRREALQDSRPYEP